QASHLRQPQERMIYTIKTAGRATFLTSFTTAAAYAANTFSQATSSPLFFLCSILSATLCLNPTSSQASSPTEQLPAVGELHPGAACQPPTDFSSPARSDLSGCGCHVLAGLGDGSSGGNFSVNTCRIFSGLLSAPGGGIPAGWGDSFLDAWTELSERQRRTLEAVNHVGVAIVSSAVTTAISTVPLFFCVIVPFAKFGQIVAINTAISILFTLSVTSALLACMAPARFSRHPGAVLKASLAVVAAAGLGGALCWTGQQLGASAWRSLST
ncbi:hypothetical protein XENOCAPTIV_001855, partial [Xenoophorus captivus]